MAARRAFELLLILSLISGCIGIDPCTNYKMIWMEYGRRSSDFNSWNTETSICDAYLDPKTWYRFEHDAGNRLIERPVEPWYCGTQAGIWLNGTHPNDTTEVTALVCATYSSTNTCGWNGTIRIQMCNETGSEYFVYLLAAPIGCPLAYCVDAATRTQCVPPDIWLTHDFKCGENITTTPAPPAPPTTPSTSTGTPGPGWSTWGPWSSCSKPCDYGRQTRRRTCGQLPCSGEATSEQTCSEFNCEELPEEKDEGAVLNLQSGDAAKDTMLLVVSNQQKIDTILRSNINIVCSQNASLCCGINIENIPSNSIEFVTSDDIYAAKGSPKPNSDGTVQYKIIAVIDDTVYKETCGKKTSSRLIARQAKSTDPSFIPFEVMDTAAKNSAYEIRQETGLAVANNLKPLASSASCPVTTCIVPIVVVIIVIAAAVVGLSVCCCMLHKTKKSKTEPKVPPSKSEKDEIRPTSSRMIIPTVILVKTEMGSQLEKSS